MKSLYVGDLTPNETVTAFFLVLNKEIRQKKTGEPYLSLLVADKTGELEAKMWDNVAEVMDTFDRDDFVKLKGLLQIYQKRSQFTIHKLRRLEDHEVDFADFFPCAERDPGEMWTELMGTICSIGDPHLRGLLQNIFADESIASRYRFAPAAKSIHHACRGGLLQHVLSLCALAKLTAPHYSGVDPDLVLAGAILHDIGKIEELTYSRSFNYSTEGQLLGHIVIGLRMVGDHVRMLPDFPPRLRNLLEHLIVSHHGELEFGSPKMPAFPEALLLHHLDNLDSKMEAMRGALARDARGDGEVTGWVPSLERVVVRKDRYLQLPLPALPPAPLPIPVNPSRNDLPAEETWTEEVLPPPTPHEKPVSSPAVRHTEKQPVNTLFGDKLQAVLSSDK